MDNFLSIDPSYSGLTGFCFFENKAPSKWGTITAENVSFYSLRSSYLEKTPLLVIEEQGFIRGNNITNKKLVLAASWWTIPARDIFSLPVVEVSPFKWLIACQRGYRPGIKKDLGALSDYIRARWGIKTVKPDEVSAICLGTYFIDNGFSIKGA